MNPSMFSPGKLPPQKWENVDTRNGAISSGHAVATESLHRNCRDGCHGNHRTCLSGSFHDVLPNMHEIHNEAALYGASGAQRAPVHLTYNYSGQRSEHFCDHDHHQGMSNERFYQGITSSATTISNHTGHQHSVCDRGCCGSVALHREKNSLANCSLDKTRPTSRSSLFVDSPEFHRNAVAVGSLSHCPSTPREVERMSSSLSTRSMANSGFPMQIKGANNQVMLYGWFLMNPHRERNSKDPPPGFSVAIGGYRCPSMEETDFFATATVVERLERWKLRTSDGIEVGLMGMINIEKSVANGFSPSLVQCFTIGFPSAWVYMLLNLQKCVPKGSSPGMLSLSARPTNSAGPSGVIRNDIKDCLGTPVTLATEANVVQSILQSSLFTAGPDVETRMADLRRCSTAATTPSHDGVSSDANSMPQSHLGHEQVVADVPEVGPNIVSTAATTPLHDGVSSDANSIPQSHLGHEQVVADIPVVGPNIVSTAATTPLHDGVSSDGNSIPQSHLGHEQVVTDIPEVGPNIVSAADPVGTVKARDKRKKPRSESQSPARDKRKKPRSKSRSPARDERKEPRSECQSPAVETPEVKQIKVSDGDPVGMVAPRDRRKLRSNDGVSSDANSIPQSHLGHEQVVADIPVAGPNIVSTAATLHDGVSSDANSIPQSHLGHEQVVTDIPEVRPNIVSVADPVGTVKVRDKRKKPRSESQSPARDKRKKPRSKSRSPARDERKKPRSECQSPAVETPEVKQIKVSDGDPVGMVTPRDRRKLRSNAPVADIPVVEPITPVGTVKARDKRKKPRSESQSPVAETPEVKQVKVSDADLVGMVTPRDRRTLRSNAPVADIPVLEPIAVSVADPVGTAKTRDRRKRPRSESRSPVPDSPLVEPVTGTANNFRSSDCHVGASPDVTEEKAEAELHEELEEDDIVIKREDLDVEVIQACKGKSVVKGRLRKKRFKISRNYYQRGKKKSSSKTALAHEKVPPRSDTCTSTLKIVTEESKVETDESQVVQEMTKPSKEKAGRSTKSTKRETPKSSSSLEVPESSAEEGHVRRSGRIKTSIVPPPLPPPRVADKSKVTEAFGLKRSQHGRVLVPPLATWRSQSIKYDMDGSIIAIYDGFEGSEEENCTGYYNFKPPEDKDARTMQRRLCKAADKGSRKR